jgi:hypothetical protein
MYGHKYLDYSDGHDSLGQCCPGINYFERAVLT